MVPIANGKAIASDSRESEAAGDGCPHILDGIDHLITTLLELALAARSLNGAVDADAHGGDNKLALLDNVDACWVGWLR